MTLRDEIAMAICLAGCGIAAHRSDYYGEADAAILALRQWLADEGLVVVPREATEGMWIAGSDKYASIGSDNLLIGDFESIWTAMIAAAPDALETKP